MVSSLVAPSSRDRKIGWILIGVGGLWIAFLLYGFYMEYTSPFNQLTLGQALFGVALNALIPVLLILSGQYYLLGKNAERLAKKRS